MSAYTARHQPHVGAHEPPDNKHESWHYNVKSDLLHPAFLRSVSKLRPVQLVHFIYWAML